MLFKKILDFFIPNLCLKCKTSVLDYGLCSDCFKSINFITKPYCNICSHPFTSRAKGKICGSCLKSKPKYVLRSAVEYNEDSSQIILTFKHAEGLNLAPYMAGEMIKAISDIKDDVDLIIPVPLHKLRLLKRTYNQSALLGKIITKDINKPIDVLSVIRTKNTKSQGNKTYNQRHKNIKSAFKVAKPNNIKGKNILLVDDVYTTGATLDELSKTLLKAGANKIYAVSFAKVVR
ncbi:MAG: double zinc ribbon domain-containing protein [Alphaproteobacteria bacterium]